MPATRVRKVIPAKVGKLYDIVMYQTHDINDFMKRLRSRVVYKPIMKGMLDANMVLKKAVIKNITSMKAALSGFMRNSFNIDMRSFEKAKFESNCGTPIWYAWVVHQGLGVHQSGGRGRPGKMYEPSAAEKAMIPADIIRLQQYLLKRKKARVKGKRPFFIKAVDETKNVMVVYINKGIQEGIERAFKGAKPSKESLTK